MAETFKCAFLILAFFTCFQILSIEGRPIKPTNKQELLTHEKEPLKEMASQSRNTSLHQSTADNQKVSLTSPPVHIPSVHHSKGDIKESQPMVPHSSDSPSVRHPETPGANSNNGPSVNAFKDDFESTAPAPGHSPGVGHIHADEDQDDSEDVDPKALGFGSSGGRAGVAFKPTKPGHSPGVGHISSVNQSDKTDPKTSNFENSVSEHFVTAPGHNFGFSHILVGQDQDGSEDYSKEPGFGSSFGRAGAAFKPTTPGHSPGVGHMLSVDQSDKIDPNPSNIEHSITTPSHSPGVGHILADQDQDDNEDVDPKAPGSSSNVGRASAAFKPTKPGHSPGVGHMSSVDQSDKTDPKASKFEQSVTEHSVTTLGHSSRFDHILAGQDQYDSEDDSKEIGFGSSIGRAGAAFKPTTPGHSPGVGHMSSVDQSDKIDPNPSNIEHSITTPGHSPGVGHILVDQDQDDNEDVDPKAPGSGSSVGRAGAAFKPTTPGHSPGVDHMSSVDQSDKTDLRPSNIENSVTTSGLSHGVGHILADQNQDDNEDVDPKAPGSSSSMGHASAAFKPTTPGHSPGVGHMSFVDQSDKTGPNPSNIEHSVTTPGHSPRVGYILADQDQDDNDDIDPKAPGSGSSVGRAGAAFKPTKPGHSLGVGHMSSVDQSDKTDPNQSNIEHSVTRVPNF